MLLCPLLLPHSLPHPPVTHHAEYRARLVVRVVNQELNTTWGLGDEAWVGSIQIHIEKSPALEEQLSGPFPADGPGDARGLAT